MGASPHHAAAEMRAPARALRIHLVWTREIDDVPMAGRIKVAQGVRQAFRAAGFSVTETTIRPVLSLPRIRSLMTAIGQLLASAAKGRPMPLQCLLFSVPAEAQRVIAELPQGCDVVYLDGVRCVAVLDALRRYRPSLAIVTDLDDLMSRRMSLLLDLNQPPSTGYLKASMPRLVERLLGWGWLSRMLLRYESASLRQVERHVARGSDALVLISSEDASVLQKLSPGARVRSIPLAAQVRRADPRIAPGPVRFIFVGTDALRQNQLTIDFLLDLWRREAIATPLVIYGEQHRSLQLPANVSMPGYVENIEDIYDGRSLVVSPCFIGGGVKTKVLEAFAHAAPVLGNRITFEGIEISADYPLLVEEESDMVDLLMNPQRHRQRFERAAAAGLQVVREHHDPAGIERAWSETIVDAVGRCQLSSRNFKSN